MHQTAQLTRRALARALVMLERSAGKLARSVLRGLGGSDPAWLPTTRRLYHMARRSLMAEPRDSWSKIDIVARSVAAIFLPVVLLIVGNWYAGQQRRAAESRLAEEQKASDDRLAQERLIDLNQRN